MKYQVRGFTKVFITIEVEAESPDEAIDIAYDDFCGMSSYCGNGGMDKLVGVAQSNVSLDPSDDFEFTEAYPE
jgi:hypothetical protein